MIRDTARDYAQSKLQPRILEAYRDETTDRAIFDEMGDLGLLGVTLPEDYGGAAATYVAYGLVAREVERVDSGYRSMMSVQSSLVMHPDSCVRQRRSSVRKYLPKSGRAASWVGCFGLTEPGAGSDPGRHAHPAPNRIDAGGYRLNGSEDLDLECSPIADVFVVWAKSDGAWQRYPWIHSRERHAWAFGTEDRQGKLSLRASITGEIFMDRRP